MKGTAWPFPWNKHPKLFSHVYVNMVRAGEASGSLDLVLCRLADLSERQQAIRGRVRAALAYPAFMLLIGAVVLFFLMTFVVPGITRIFDDMDRLLPLPTLVLMGFSRFLQNSWWILLLLLGGAVFAFRKLVRTPKGQRLWDRIKLTFPLFGALYTRMAMARFARTLGSLLQNGVPLLTALGIVGTVVQPTLISEGIERAMEDISSLNGNPVFVQEIRNPNLEIRNNDQNPKCLNDRNGVFSIRCFCHLNIRYSDLFRISIFDIRICAQRGFRSGTISSGKALAASLSASPWFTPITLQMIAAGEQSGELETMLAKIADAYEQEVWGQPFDRLRLYSMARADFGEGVPGPRPVEIAYWVERTGNGDFHPDAIRGAHARRAP